MNIQIVGVGFGRTGTDSTRAALSQLGFPCYHMHEVVDTKKNPGHLEFWRQVGEAPPGTQHDWNRVFANYAATIDNPAACVWRELLDANPDAKVLLTLHPGGPDAWYDSTWETIYSPQRMWQWKVMSTISPFGRKMAQMTRQLIWDRFYHGTMDDRAAAIERYEAHTRDVLESVPEERLLVFRASDGWEPLCRFLDVPVPEEPFPRINDRATMKRRLNLVASLAYAVIAVSALAVAGLGYLLAQWL